MDEWTVSVIKAMYEDATTKVRLNGRESNAFSVRVEYMRNMFSVHCLWNCFMQMISF